mgnify:CR=1 FL=1
MRMDGLPCLSLWSQIIDVLHPELAPCDPKGSAVPAARLYDIISLEFSDWVPPSLPQLRKEPKLVFVEDNDAVLKMCVKGRAPTLKLCSRTHRIDLDWLFERVREDPRIFGRYFILACSSLICSLRVRFPLNLGLICVILCV